ncbi:MAG: hypothetical protein V1492_04075 [Candidatus Micrarchaeota archaeon]
MSELVETKQPAQAPPDVDLTAKKTKLNVYQKFQQWRHRPPEIPRVLTVTTEALDVFESKADEVRKALNIGRMQPNEVVALLEKLFVYARGPTVATGDKDAIAFIIAKIGSQRPEVWNAIWNSTSENAKGIQEMIPERDWNMLKRKVTEFTKQDAVPLLNVLAAVEQKSGKITPEIFESLGNTFHISFALETAQTERVWLIDKWLSMKVIPTYEIGADISQVEGRLAAILFPPSSPHGRQLRDLLQSGDPRALDILEDIKSGLRTISDNPKDYLFKTLKSKDYLAFITAEGDRKLPGIIEKAGDFDVLIKVLKSRGGYEEFVTSLENSVKASEKYFSTLKILNTMAERHGVGADEIRKNAWRFRDVFTKEWFGAKVDWTLDAFKGAAGKTAFVYGWPWLKIAEVPSAPKGAIAKKIGWGAVGVLWTGVTLYVTYEAISLAIRSRWQSRNAEKIKAKENLQQQLRNRGAKSVKDETLEFLVGVGKPVMVYLKARGALKALDYPMTEMGAKERLEHPETSTLFDFRRIDDFVDMVKQLIHSTDIQVEEKTWAKVVNAVFGFAGAGVGKAAGVVGYEPAAVRSKFELSEKTRFKTLLGKPVEKLTEEDALYLQQGGLTKLLNDRKYAIAAFFVPGDLAFITKFGVEFGFDNEKINGYIGNKNAFLEFYKGVLDGSIPRCHVVNRKDWNANNAAVGLIATNEKGERIPVKITAGTMMDLLDQYASAGHILSDDFDRFAKNKEKFDVLNSIKVEKGQAVYGIIALCEELTRLKTPQARAECLKQARKPDSSYPYLIASEELMKVDKAFIIDTDAAKFVFKYSTSTEGIMPWLRKQRHDFTYTMKAHEFVTDYLLPRGDIIGEFAPNNLGEKRSEKRDGEGEGLENLLTKLTGKNEEAGKYRDFVSPSDSPLAFFPRLKPEKTGEEETETTASAAQKETAKGVRAVHKKVAAEKKEKWK